MTHDDYNVAWLIIVFGLQFVLFRPSLYGRLASLKGSTMRLRSR
jgi:hypothetical protein